MERELFSDKLIHATNQASIFARDIVEEELPDGALYLIRPNCSYDGNPLEGDLEVFPEDSLPADQVHLPPTDTAGVGEFLWRHGKVPEWINIQVARADTHHTILFLTCCGRFTGTDKYYAALSGYWPFHVLGPQLPREWAAERSALRRELHRQGNWGPLPPISEMVARHGKFRLENRQVESWRKMSEHRSEEPT